MNLKLEQIADEIIETDFLIIGAGLAGCMAALRAKSKGNIDVALIERASIKYGGDSIGVDDHSDWRPEFYKKMIQHPLPKGFPSAEELKRPKHSGPNKLRGGLLSWQLAVNEAKNYAPMVKTLNEIGVRLHEDDGTVKIRQERPVPGLPHWHKPMPDDNGKIDADWILYRGTDLKVKLADAVLKSGTRVFQRTMVTGLLVNDGTVVGATAFNMRTGKFVVFKAKTVLMSTGGIRRLYIYPFAPFPNNLFYSRSCTGNHGGGVAAALRAGAKLANLEYLYIRIAAAGACTTSGAGGGWYWDLRDSQGNFINMWAALSQNMEEPPILRDVLKFDRGSAVNEAVVGCYFTAATEYPRALKLHKLAGGMGEGAPIEVRPFLGGITHGGILPVNEHGESSLKNLYAAGDASCGLGDGGSRAITWGGIIGDRVRETVADIKAPDFDAAQLQQVGADRERVYAPMGNSGGVAPLELEDYVRKINMNYIGIHKNGPRLQRAAEIMRIAREKFVPSLTAKDPHELMRALEVRDIIDISELHAECSLRRTESRDMPNHYRLDYPKQDDENWLHTLVTVQKTAGETDYRTEKAE